LPVLRVILVRIPPLLADLIRQVVDSRFERHRAEQLAQGRSKAPRVVFTSTVDIKEINALARSVSGAGLPGPHVIILGPTTALGTMSAQPGMVQVLSLSPDLTRIEGPEEGMTYPLTPDVLADLLLAIAEKI
jgi:hypothetical protein